MGKYEFDISIGGIEKKLIISEAEFMDLKEIRRLQIRNFQVENKRYESKFKIGPLTESQKEIERKFQDKNWIFLKAMVDDAIIGAVRAEIEGNVSDIGRIFVGEKFRGAKVAKHLIESVEKISVERVRPRHLEYFHVFTGQKNVESLTLCTKSGYEIFGFEHLQDDIFLVKMRKPVVMREK